MKEIVIIGGRLQGTEAVYLAKKAGLKAVVIDLDQNSPARGMCDEFYGLDLCGKGDALLALLQKADYVLPAMENDQVLAALKEYAETCPVNLLFDFDAYAVSSSKSKSDQMFLDNRIPAPLPYPLGKAPYIAKPAGGSGSQGVTVLATEMEAEQFQKERGTQDWVVQEYLTGSSYSIEVIGRPGRYRTYQVTEIHMDEVYDCRKVTCPCSISEGLKKQFSDLAVELAGLVSLKGIMDVEVILHRGELRVLEIDARLPSQTPAAIYRSTGVNLLTELCRLFDEDWEGEMGAAAFTRELPAAYEHLLVKPAGKLTEHGEHLMSSCGPLLYYKDRFGSDELLTDWVEGDREMRATLINTGTTEAELGQKREALRRQLRSAL